MNKTRAITIVIFGATGDLTKRKLIPALFALHNEHRIKDFQIIAVGRREFTDQKFRDHVKPSTAKDWINFSKNITYHKLEFTNTKEYALLTKKLSFCTNIAFYFATAPEYFSIIAEQLRKHKLTNESIGWRRVIIEKPFGNNLLTAQALNTALTKAFSEEQIYRIDHYLGKEFVQNILVLRFTNTILDHLWHKHIIDHVQITVSQKDGIGTRAGYYDNAGAARDFFQSHILQLIALVAMEPPGSLTAEAIRNEKMKVLEALEYAGVLDESTVRGQYAAGIVDAKKAIGYIAEANVPKQSRTETFVAAKLALNNFRFAGVPFYVRTGKRTTDVADIHIVLKDLPCLLFCALPTAKTRSNVLTISIQPKQGIALRLNGRSTGHTLGVQPVKLEYCQNCTFGSTPEAYELLFADIIRGDHTLFTSWEEVKRSWQITDKLHEHWKKNKNLPLYPAGSSGPKEADILIEQDGRRWI